MDLDKKYLDKIYSLPMPRTLDLLVRAAVMSGLVGGASQALATTTLWDRLNLVTENSDVASSSKPNAFSPSSIAGSRFTINMNTDFSLSQYSVMASSHSGLAFDFTTNPLGDISLLLFKENGLGGYDLLPAINANLALSPVSATNTYGDQIVQLDFNILSSVNLGPGNYIISPYQSATNFDTEIFYLNLISPENEHFTLNDWTAVFSGTEANAPANFAALNTVSETVGFNHFADRLTGTLSIPEPGQAMLVFAGLAAILFARRRA